MNTITIIASQSNKNNENCSIETDNYGQFNAPYLSLLVPALKKKGYKVEVVAWDDDIDWGAKSCILMGPAWDYTKDIQKFHVFLNHLTSVKGLVLNDPDGMLWNLDKTYLKDLEKNGVPHQLASK